MKSKNRDLNHNNYEFEKCTKKQRKMHKLCIKSSERESKSLNSKILEKLNHCRNFMNLNSNSNSNDDCIENADQEMQNADKTQSAQNSQNENEIKSSNIEMRIEKTIDEKMRKIQSHLNKKLNQIMNLIQSRTSTTNVQTS